MNNFIILAFLLLIPLINSEVLEDCSPQPGACVHADEDVLRMFENVEYSQCMALCQSVTGCKFITWRLHGSCVLLDQCAHVEECQECQHSQVCPRLGAAVKLAQNNLDITIDIDNKQWFRSLKIVLI